MLSGGGLVSGLCTSCTIVLKDRIGENMDRFD